MGEEAEPPKIEGKVMSDLEVGVGRTACDGPHLERHPHVPPAGLGQPGGHGSLHLGVCSCAWPHARLGFDWRLAFAPRREGHLRC